ncbi:MAG: cytochrome c3 family protein, partial [Duodenibacillus sp.]|nr:cytochrome c3 family protein [Duodenibacillus sp.]
MAHYSFARTLLWGVAASLVFASSAIAAEKFGADRHVERGVPCTACHGPDMKNPVYPDENTCLQCHKKADVAAKTKKLNPNPHNAPHNGD